MLLILAASGLLINSKICCNLLLLHTKVTTKSNEHPGRGLILSEGHRFLGRL